ncbi:hypothetical protein A6A25_39340 [Saccharothrix sp. CB00851]|nr:hypothetical protein A6A25_39340 [Saccharothrix sp. CB00851]
MIATAAVTAAVVPFVQAIAKKAADDSYDAVRGWLKGLFRDSKAKRIPPGGAPKELLVVTDLDPKIKLYLPTDLSDQAIRALEQLDLDTGVARGKRDKVTKLPIYFDERTGTWRIGG